MIQAIGNSNKTIVTNIGYKRFNHINIQNDNGNHDNTTDNINVRNTNNKNTNKLSETYIDRWLLAVATFVWHS